MAIIEITNETGDEIIATVEISDRKLGFLEGLAAAKGISFEEMFREALSEGLRSLDEAIEEK